MKPRLFILWGSPYTFAETLAPQIPALAAKFQIVLAMTDHRMTESARSLGNMLKAEGTVEDFFVLPVWSGSMLAQHRLMRGFVELTRAIRFDAFLSVSTALPYERYITEFICPRAFRILYWPHLVNTHLDIALSDALQSEGPLPRAGARSKQGETRFLLRIFDRYIYPLIYAHRIFAPGRFDSFSQIGTQFDLMLLHSETDAADFRRIYGRIEIRAVAFPRVPLPTERWNAILMPFSLHDEQEAHLLYAAYRRDLRTALRETGAPEIHLRVHPGRSDPWLSTFTESLRRDGVPIFVVGAHEPVTTQAARYRGCIGAASAALRDVRLACKDLFVVGLDSLSQGYTLRAKRLLGLGVEWIEADGRCDPSLFTPRTVNTGLPEAADVIIEAYEGAK